MANTQVQFGFQPYGITSGTVPNFGLRRRFIAYNYATALYRGDPVCTTSDGTLVIAPDQTTPLAGIFWGCSYFSASANIPVKAKYWPGVSLGNAGYEVVAYIYDDPEMQFIAAELGSTAALTASNVGQNFQFNAGAGGSTQSGISSYVIDDAHITTTSTLPFKITDLYATVAPPGQNGTAAALYNWAVVKMNNTERAAGTTAHA